MCSARLNALDSLRERASHFPCGGVPAFLWRCQFCGNFQAAAPRRAVPFCVHVKWHRRRDRPSLSHPMPTFEALFPHILFRPKSPEWAGAGGVSPAITWFHMPVLAHDIYTTQQALERLTEGLEDARHRAETAEALLEELQRGICPTLASTAVSHRQPSPHRQSSRHCDHQGQHHSLSPYSFHRARSPDGGG